MQDNTFYGEFLEEWREDFALKVFGILSEQDGTLGGQKEACRQIADLLLPPNASRYALKAIIEQLESCGFECEGGPLRLNTAFVALKEMANAPRLE